MIQILFLCFCFFAINVQAAEERANRTQLDDEQALAATNKDPHPYIVITAPRGTTRPNCGEKGKILQRPKPIDPSSLRATSSSTGNTFPPELVEKYEAALTAAEKREKEAAAAEEIITGFAGLDPDDEGNWV